MNDKFITQIGKDKKPVLRKFPKSAKLPGADLKCRKNGPNVDFLEAASYFGRSDEKTKLNTSIGKICELIYLAATSYYTAYMF